MFLRMYNCPALPAPEACLTYANHYIQRALAAPPTSARDALVFLCGPAGIHAVAAAIARANADERGLSESLQSFAAGFEACTTAQWDEILVGRAGFLSGVHWLNAGAGEDPAVYDGPDQWFKVCDQMMQRGRAYALKHSVQGTPIMFDYHDTEYLGAAHGLSGILQVMLMQPAWMAADKAAERDVWSAVDWLAALQDADGNFPTAIDSAQRGDRKLVHWCHGAPGVIHMLLQANRLRPHNAAYLNGARRAADACWQRGLLRKGPGICHGVAGNGLASLVMYRETDEMRYLHRAVKFAEFLEDAQFLTGARQPDRPHSLYEGIAGTVCFLCDLLEPARASFPFMAVR